MASRALWRPSKQFTNSGNIRTTETDPYFSLHLLLSLVNWFFREISLQAKEVKTSAAVHNEMKVKNGR